MNQFPNVREIDFGDRIEKLRALIYEYVQQNPGQVDIEDVRNRITPPEEVQMRVEDPNSRVIHDWMLKRCLIMAKVPLDLQSALDKFVQVFEFRAKYQVSKLTLHNSLSKEFFPLGIYVFDESMTDRNGNRLFILRLKYYKKIVGLDQLIKRAMVYIIEQHDLEFEQGQFDGVTLLGDLQGFDYRHVSIDMMKFAVKLGFMYAGPLKSVLVYNLPWTFSFLLQMIETWINVLLGFKLDIFHLVNRNNIIEFVDKENLPDFLNGSKVIDFVAPPNALPFDAFVKSLDFVIEEKNVQQIKDYLEQLLQL